MVEIIEQISNVNQRHMEVDIPHKAVPRCIETQLLLHPGFVIHVFPQIKSERMMVLMSEVRLNERILRISSNIWKVGSTEVIDGWILNEIGGVEERVAGTITMPLQGRGYLMIWICWCRRENGSLYYPAIETTFGQWNRSLSLQDVYT